MVKVQAKEQPAPRSQRSRSPFVLFNLIVCGVALVLFEVRFQNAQMDNNNNNSKSGTTANSTSSALHVSCDPNVIYRGPAGLPVLRSREKLGRLLQARKFTTGAEIGVQRGDHSLQLLTAWERCQQFYLVDLWGYQENYVDPANQPQDAQDAIFRTAQAKLQPWTNKNVTTFYRMKSTQAAEKIPDQSLDFVYVDARHDYCGVLEDLEAYYPKIRPGGIVSGHDFLSVAEQKALDPNQDWSRCLDGSVNQGAVKGAVETFARKHGLSFSVMYSTTAWTSWMLQKPTRMECVQEMGAYGSDIVGFE